MEEDGLALRLDGVDLIVWFGSPDAAAGVRWRSGLPLTLPPGAPHGRRTAHCRSSCVCVRVAQRKIPGRWNPSEARNKPTPDQARSPTLPLPHAHPPSLIPLPSPPFPAAGAAAPGRRKGRRSARRRRKPPRSRPSRLRPHRRRRRPRRSSRPRRAGRCPGRA